VYPKNHYSASSGAGIEDKMMSDQNEVYIVVFDRLEKADRALREVLQQVQNGEITLQDVVAIRKNAQGRVSLLQTKDWSAEEGAIGGGVVGMLVGTLLGGPIGGALFGVGLGALYAHLTDFGLDDQLMREFGMHMQPEHSAIAVLTTSAEAEKITARLSEYEGILIHAALPAEAYKALQAALRTGHPAQEAEIEEL
jgi:uncharacterized membrane protein